MQNEILDQWSSFTKNSITPLVKINEIAGKAFQNAAKQNLELINDVFTTNVNTLQTLANTKKAEDFLAVQAKMVQDSGNKAIKHAQKSLEMFVDTTNAFSKCFEDSFSTVVTAIDKNIDKAKGK